MSGKANNHNSDGSPEHERLIEQCQDRLAQRQAVVLRLRRQLDDLGGGVGVNVDRAGRLSTAARRDRLRAELKEARAALRAERDDLRRHRRVAAGWNKAYRRLTKLWKRVAGRPEQMLPTGLERSLAGEQLRAARGLLGLSGGAFAALLGLDDRELRTLEKQRGVLDLPPRRQSELRRRLRKAGVELIAPGVYVGAGGFGVRHVDTSSEPADVVGLRRDGAPRRRRQKPRARRDEPAASAGGSH